MHDIEPFWNWRHKYTAEEDDRSPFFGEEHSEFEFTNAVYDHVIHPQWESIGSATLYLKQLYTDYDEGEAFEFCPLCFAEQKAYDDALGEGEDAAFAAMEAYKASNPR